MRGERTQKYTNIRHLRRQGRAVKLPTVLLDKNMSMNRNLRRCVYAFLAYFSISSIGIAGVPSDSDLRQRLDIAESRWERLHITTYSYVIERSCQTCEPPAEVVVRKGKCKIVRTVGSPRRSLTCEGRAVPELFQMIRSWIDDSSGSVVDATFDEQYGYPLEITIRTNIPQDSERFRFRSFHASAHQSQR